MLTWFDRIPLDILTVLAGGAELFMGILALNILSATGIWRSVRIRLNIIPDHKRIVFVEIVP